LLDSAELLFVWRYRVDAADAANQAGWPRRIWAGFALAATVGGLVVSWLQWTHGGDLPPPDTSVRYFTGHWFTTT